MMVLKILNACLTPIIALIAVYIAYQQYSIHKKNSEQQFYLNQKKINLDLYQLRFRIFEETKKILLKISKDAQIDIIEVRDYYFSINESQFLFEDDIIIFLKELQTKSIDLTHITKELNNLQAYPVNSAQRELKVKEWANLNDFFTHEYQNLEQRFMKYLDFKKI
jgi:hypothetical protein